MIVAIFNVYLVILFVLVKLNVVRFNLFWKCSPAIVMVLLLFGLFIPMGWGAPQGPAIVIRNSVSIVPNVAGEVIAVPVEPNTPLKTGDVLLKIDPMPFQAQVDALAAQLKFAKLRLSQMSQLQANETGRAFDVQERQASVDQLTAQFAGTQYSHRRLRDQSRPAQRCARRRAAAIAGDGVRRYVGDDRRRRNPAKRRPVHSAVATSRGYVQGVSRPCSHGKSRGSLAGDRNRASSGVRPCRLTEADRVRAARGACRAQQRG